VKCMYCGSDIIVREAIKLAGGVTVDNLLVLGKNAENVGDYNQAYDYYSKAFEFDSNNSLAWTGKAVAAAFTKRTYEVMQCIKNAIQLNDQKNTPEEIVTKLENNIKNYDHCYYDKAAFSSLAQAILKYNPNSKPALILNYLHGVEPSFDSLIKAINIAKNDIVFREKLINMTLKKGNDKNLADIIINSEISVIANTNNIYKDSISTMNNVLNDFLTIDEKLALYDDIVNKTTYRIQRKLYKDYSNILYESEVNRILNESSSEVNIRDKYIQEIIKINKNYNPPSFMPRGFKINRDPSRFCFIATAAYGSPLADEIILLKKFRDDYLSLTPWGNRLIALYYRYSPRIAAFIAKSEVVRKIARACLTPIISLIKAIQKKEADQP
jgi:tetratricopeptide (TPR) repeat protein